MVGDLEYLAGDFWKGICRAEWSVIGVNNDC